MTKKLTHWLLTIIATALTLVMLCGTLGVFRGMSASAAELDLAPAGWYVMGNGASRYGLKDCSWLEFKEDFLLTGTPEEEGEVPENYLGTWETSNLALYAGDQFKVLYTNGAYEDSDAAGWKDGFSGDIYQIPTDLRGNFDYGVYGNIRIKEGYEGWYTFYVGVYKVEDEVQIEITYIYDNTTPLPALEQYEMYVVGRIASVPELAFPDDVVEGRGGSFTLLPMTAHEVEENGELVVKYYSAAIYFITTDEIKVFNLVDSNYYPDGVENAVSPEEEGTFYVEWTQDAPSFVFVAESELPPFLDD